ncbi:hypothetical protein GOBAR_AA07130 [Gossypium barbadense]|uniref:Uncharacterized protein n=1 Tax=Gossypium barbadense TaxID=3634 RepID=A0A2P5YCY4_GOSBA|nr:hypothetical protein GOBAR_AA07130 [Gossypium barbadense]
MVQPSLMKMSLKEAHELFSSNSRGPVHEDQRLQIEEFDEWQTHKPRTPNKPKLRQNEPDTSPNKLKVGDKVLLDAADPHIVTTTPNEEIPLTVLSIFPFSTVEVSHPKFSTFKATIKHHGRAIWPWSSLPKQHRRTTRTCGRTVGEPDKIARACDMPVSNTRSRTCQINTGVELEHTGMELEHMGVELEHTKLDTAGRHTRVNSPARGTRAWTKCTQCCLQEERIAASKKGKGASSSAGPTAKIHHPLLQFPRGPQEELFQILRARPLIAGHCIDWAAIEHVQMADAIRALLTTDLWELFFGIIEPTYLGLTMELCSTFHLQTVMTRYDDPSTVQFRLGGLIRQLSIPEFGATLGLYTEEFKEKNELQALSRHIHFSPPKCWHTLVPSTASYNPNRSKASVLPPSLRYLHDILAHTITGRRDSTGIVNTHDVYFF